MPKRIDIKTILLIGSGPIVIGQACEFDYSGTQAIKALKEEGYKVILVNSNPATIMTDPEFADKTYIEPITVEFVEKIIAKERPCAILPTMGGQTALNIAIDLEEKGILKKYDCELIGAKVDSIKMAEDRELFKQAMNEIGLNSAKSFCVTSLEEAKKYSKELGFPLILRPSRTLGGSGGGIVYSEKEFEEKVLFALSESPNSEVLLEESLLNWKEIELEVMRDKNDNVVIICGIENFDAMGVHTGDSITVAPIQTLTDKEYQRLRNQAIKIVRKIGVDTGGCNVQFTINPEDGRVIVIEMNPRVSRSSALASKATGFPIAKIAAKLAVGYSLDEIPNDITKMTPASFEPSIDYVVVKMPRFAFEKFPSASNVLGTQMKSVGEAMSFGRSFKEALQKAIVSLEVDSSGFDKFDDLSVDELKSQIQIPTFDRIWQLGQSLKHLSVKEVHNLSGIDPWFLSEMKEIIEIENKITSKELDINNFENLRLIKQNGFSDLRISELLNITEKEVREIRTKNNLFPTYKAVDTCAAEFIAKTPYQYSTYDDEDDFEITNKKSVIILGSGPNRIGQGIEFDYCCVHAVLALKEIGIESIMVNCNPETVSTDYDISDQLYFEPLSLESVLNIINRVNPLGVIIQFGGQTPLKLADELIKNGVKILGTSVDSINFTEDRKLFSNFIIENNLKQPEFCTVTNVTEALNAATKIGYPLMIRPSFVLGGRAMKVVTSDDELKDYINESVDVSNNKPVLIDKYLENAIEVDVDVISDGKTPLIAGILEHIERAGVHSGDSSAIFPPISLSKEIIAQMTSQAKKIALKLNVIGLMNIQFAIYHNEVFIIEVNPRASRTVPFVSKATGCSIAKIALKAMLGVDFNSQNISFVPIPNFSTVKASVFPFSKFKGEDTLLGPEMKSTGEVMGISKHFAGAFTKSQLACSTNLPVSGLAFVSIADIDKEGFKEVAVSLSKNNFKFIATRGTAKYLKTLGIDSTVVNKVQEGSPNIINNLKSGKVDLVINTPSGSNTFKDSKSIRLVANEFKIPTYTTVAAAFALSQAIDFLRKVETLEVQSIQDYHIKLNNFLEDNYEKANDA